MKRSVFMQGLAILLVVLFFWSAEQQLGQSGELPATGVQPGQTVTFYVR